MLSVLFALALSQPARATTDKFSIGLNFDSEEPNGLLQATDKVGAPTVQQMNWNNLTGASGTSDPTVPVVADNKDVASDTTMIVEWSSAGTWASTGRGEENNGFPTGPDRALFTGYLDTGNATTTTITLTDVPTQLTSKGYDVYVYALGGVPGRGGGYRIVNADNDVVIRDYKAGDSPTNPSTYIEDPGFSHTDTGDYLVFRSITAAHIRIEATTENGQGFGGTPRAPVNAVQLVESAGLLTISGVQGTPLGFVVTVLDSATTQLDPNNITLTLNGTPVSASNVSVNKTADTSRITYSNGAAPLTAGTTNTVAVTVKDNTGTAVSGTLQFVVPAYATVPASFAVPAADTAQPGFKVRTVQLPGTATLENSTQAAETLLAGQYIDPSTGQPAANVADTTGADANGYFSVPDVINFNIAAPAAAGNFTVDNGHEDKPVPGIPGTEASVLNFAQEIQTYLSLKAGSYQMGVNSDDGFKVSVGPDPRDVLGVTLGEFSGGRGAADTLFSFVIPQDGVYPFRLIWEQGGGDASVEWFVVVNGVKILINDLADANTVKAYQAATGTSRPFVKSVSPLNNQTAVPLNSALSFEIQNGSATVNTSSIQLTVNGTTVTPTITPTASGATVTYTPAGGLKTSSPYKVTLTYSDSGTPSITRTANLSFVTERAPITLPPLQESGGLVVIEAENFDALIARGGHTWTFGTAIPGYVGDGYMEATPNSDSGTVSDPTTFPTTVPEMDYKINFQTTGTYYIWVRGYGPSGSSDSLHTGIDFGTDPVALDTSDRITGFGTTFSWQRARQGTPAGNPTIEVPTAGDHTFNIWMREDGTIVDRVLLTTDAAYVPAGTGPAESLRVGQVPPSISITGPTAGQTFAAGANVPITVNASVSSGSIAKVEFFANGTKIGESTTGPGFSFTYNAVPQGRYNLTAKATTAAGISTTSSPVNIVVGNPPDDVLFVNATGGPNASDQAAIAHLRSLGMNVTSIGDAASASTDALGKQLVVISSTVGSGNVGTKFTSVAVPVLSWESALLDELGLEANNVNGFTQAGQTDLVITDPTHPIAAGLSGTVTIYSSGRDVSAATTVVPDAKVVATTADGAGSALIAADKGVPLNPARIANAPERRVHFPMGNDSYLGLNADGLKLFDAAVAWAMNKPITEPQPQISVSQSTGNINITWTNGGTLEWTSALVPNAAWTSTNDSDGSYSEPVSTAQMKFFRVRR